jgi:hypothetical protein
MKRKGVIVKIRDFILAAILLFIACGSASADRQLKRAEILQIFQTLTDRPRDTWIPAGTIEATHQEFKAASGYTVDSTVIVKYDGDRFYWEINIDSQVREAKDKGNTSRHDFNLNWNRKRVFAWDGQRYTMYFRPGNDAIVTENSSSFGALVNGPLTAGIIPWGYGFYTYQNLSEVESSATEVVVSGQKQIHLTLRKINTPEIVFVLDLEKDYAVLSCSMYTAQSSILKTYEDYQLAAGKWIPTTIMIERYDNSRQLNELFSYDYWEIMSIDANPPQEDSFSVAYETDAFVRYNSPVTNGPLTYHYSDNIDTELLLQSRLANASAQDRAGQNCATIAMKYVAGQLGKNVSDPNLAQLVNEQNKDTSLYELRRFAQELGLHCLAVKTDIQTLRNVQDCQVILHLPKAKHYVVLDHIDEEYVWAIDLDGNKFYYRTKLNVFGSDWSDGTALLVSNSPLNVEGTFIEVNDQAQRNIIGSASGGFGTYSCTDLIQEYDIIFCSEPIFGLCGGRYTKFFTCYGCILDEDGGSCTGGGIVGNVSSPCVEDPWYPGYCDITGEWFSRSIRSCYCEDI